MFPTSERQHIGFSSRKVCAALIIAGLGIFISRAEMASAETFLQNELAHRSLEIHWPAGYSPNQRGMFAHVEIDINAPSSTVWNSLLQAEQWPRWYSNAMDVHVAGDSGALRKDSDFTWVTFGVYCQCKVAEYSPDSRIGWYCQGNEFSAYDAWLITPTGKSSCHVVVEISMDLTDLRVDKDGATKDLHNTRVVWLQGLKNFCERPEAYPETKAVKHTTPFVPRVRQPIPEVRVGPLTGGEAILSKIQSTRSSKPE